MNLFFRLSYLGVVGLLGLDAYGVRLDITMSPGITLVFHSLLSSLYTNLTPYLQLLDLAVIHALYHHPLSIQSSLYSAVLHVPI